MPPPGNLHEPNRSIDYFIYRFFEYLNGIHRIRDVLIGIFLMSQIHPANHAKNF